MSFTKPPPPSTTRWRLRVRFKMYRTAANTSGAVHVGLGYYETVSTYDVSAYATQPTIDVINYAAGEWHDIELFFEASGYAWNGTRVLGAMVGGRAYGGEIWISDIYVDEGYATGPGLPQVVQGGAYTLALADNGTHIYISTGGVTIPNNSSIAFPVETFVMIINNSGSPQTIAKGGSVTLNKAGTGSVASLQLAIYGRCELVKTAADTWNASGNI